jgi:hypothetical protein
VPCAVMMVAGVSAVDSPASSHFFTVRLIQYS